jgi:uncharacterized membrane protein YcaP (DUF421 family)
MVSIRLMGRRQIGELQPSEFAVTIIVSNIATISIENIDIPIWFGIVPMLMIVAIDVIVSCIGLKSRGFRKWVSGKPKIIIKDGIIDQQQLKKIRYTIDDLMESLRGEGIFNIDEVQFAIVETTGKISFYQKYSARNVTNQDANIQGKSIDPPMVVISDGKMIPNALKMLNLSQEWLLKTITEKNLKVQDVFIMTADSNGLVYLAPKL